MNLIEFRESRGLSQQDLAVALGISRGYLSRLEQSRQAFPLRLALQIQAWSHGQVLARDLVSDEDRALMDAAAAAGDGDSPRKPTPAGVQPPSAPVTGIA